MALWLAIPLALLLLAVALILLILSSGIHFHFRLFRLGKDDRVEFDIKAVFGLVKFHYELPSLVFENIQQGIMVKLEESGIAPFRKDKDHKEQINKEWISTWLDNFRKALKATRGLKQWMKATLSHVQITKLDWSTDFSLGDAADTAVAAGALWGVKGSVIGWLSQQVRMKQAPRLFVVPVFQDELCFSTEAVLTGKMSVGYACYAGLRLLRRISKEEGGLRQWKKLLSRNKPGRSRENSE
ncbi:DUF2953 domain-containing protein [Paenibacillus sp. HW567]|uniref:DUF2953 domain-containing protein n=1 Tax=Paenibacillus sp. HW567 TaxID=1034769 RepID=UPI00036D504C|nr:DUF2953 domain-containing protein [Paenibacillus sp. HW567]